MNAKVVIFATDSTSQEAKVTGQTEMQWKQKYCTTYIQKYLNKSFWLKKNNKNVNNDAQGSCLNSSAFPKVNFE